jgi:hypothetical protein
MHNHWHVLDGQGSQENLRELFGQYRNQLCLYLQTVDF